MSVGRFEFSGNYFAYDNVGAIIFQYLSFLQTSRMNIMSDAYTSVT